MIRGLGWVLLVLGLVAIGLTLFVFDFPRVENTDMAPALQRGDLLMACRVCGAPGRGDLVVFEPPDRTGPMSIRRVVAVPGDQVEIAAGHLYVNGHALPVVRPATRVRGKLTLVDSYFVLAEDGAGARDSRDYGPVPRQRIRSTVLRVLFHGPATATYRSGSDPRSPARTR